MVSFETHMALGRLQGVQGLFVAAGGREVARRLHQAQGGHAVAIVGTVADPRLEEQTEPPRLKPGVDRLNQRAQGWR